MLHVGRLDETFNDPIATALHKRLKPEQYAEPLTPLTRREFRRFAVQVLGAKEHEVGETWVKEKQQGEYSAE